MDNLPQPTRVNFKLWAARGLIAAVFFLNVQCALLFLWEPELHAPGFELGGTAGAAVVRGMGILFLMWNVPYAVALWHPVIQRTALCEALTMQIIGALGEAMLLWGLPVDYPILRASIGRFIAFDSAGVAALAAALGLVLIRRSGSRETS